MTIPALLFGFLVSTFLGAAFHIWKGGGIGRLFLYLILAWIGFWAGQYIGDILGITIGSIGPLRLAPAVLATVIVLFIGYWLSLINQEEPQL